MSTGNNTSDLDLQDYIQNVEAAIPGMSTFEIIGHSLKVISISVAAIAVIAGYNALSKNLVS